MIRRTKVYCLLGLIILTYSAALNAHPLGNFAICHYSGMTVTSESITIKYLIDMAEIPAFQEMVEIDKDQNKEISAAERRSYLAGKVEGLKKGLILRVDDRLLPLTTVNSQLEFPPGAGGLPTLKITITYSASLKGIESKPNHRVYYEDNNYPDRLGWKEIIVRSDAPITLADISVPNQDRSRELSAYPEDMLSSPPKDVKAAFSFTRPQPSGPLAAAPVKPSPKLDGPSPVPVVGLTTMAAPEKTSRSVNSVSGTADALERADAAAVVQSVPSSAPSAPSPSPHAETTDRAATKARGDLFTALISTKDLGLNIIVISLLVAFALGAFHALSPGHGKTIVAAYLVGSRGTAKHAVFLGGVVTLTHTIGVFALGLVTLYASNYIMPEKLYPWLGFASGLTVVGIGSMLFLQRYRGLSGHHHGHHHGADHDHLHEHAHAHPHEHSHALASDHDHGHHHGHDHADDYGHHHHGHHHHHHHDLGNGEVSLRNLLALGVSGGIVPCPSALVVLLSAISLHRIGFGLVLIVAFSIGLALVLTSIGLLMVYARRFMDRFTGQGRLLQRLPVLSSLVITALGLIIAVESLVSGGILQVR